MSTQTEETKDKRYPWLFRRAVLASFFLALVLLVLAIFLRSVRQIGPVTENFTVLLALILFSACPLYVVYSSIRALTIRLSMAVGLFLLIFHRLIALFNAIYPGALQGGLFNLSRFQSLTLALGFSIFMMAMYFSLLKVVDTKGALYEEGQRLIREITQRRRAEEALRVERDKAQQYFNITPSIILALNADSHITLLNPQGCRLLECELDQAVGKNWFDTFLPARVIAQTKGIFAQVMAGEIESVEHVESLVVTGKGSERIIRWHNNVVQDEAGKIIGTLSSGEDITERKRAEEEKRSLEERLQRAEKMESLGTLAGGVAHDLNNVLGIVVGYSEMLLDGMDKSSPFRPDLENVMNGGLKAAAIVGDLLTLARRGVQGRSILNLNKIVADCQKSPEFASLCNHHPAVKIDIDLEPKLLNISGSSIHLGKTLYNLVSNASEAMPKGGTVTIKTTNQYLDKPIQSYDQILEGDYIVLSVSDTGEGISANDLKCIFEPFYTKKIMGRSGTGLGLAVVWGTVKDHNGYINVQSEQGKGSTFTLYFPVTRDDVQTAAVTVAISEYMGKGESILVVDDVKEQRDLASSMLRTLNYNVAIVSSGEQAVEYIKEHEVDLIVLDMIMDPGMDGLDTYKSILNIRPKQRAIIVSGFSESDRVITVKELGAGTYVRKPYIKEKLGLAVKKELDRK